MADQLSILNPNPNKIPGPTLLHHLVTQDISSDAIAIEYLSPHGNIERLSYTQLHARANTLAQRIRSIRDNANASPTTRFIAPVFISQCPQLYISQLAALKAGAAFCPISLDVPEDRLRFILQDVDATTVLTTTDARDSLPELHGITVICVDDGTSESNGEEPAVDTDPSDAAYVMYTSGSTGQPKGVILSHSAATQALLAHDRHIPEFNRFLQFANPTFDVSVFEIFFPLFRGRTLICGERRNILSDLPGFINKMHVDAAELTPSVASSLLQGRDSVPSLNLILTIGEMLKRDVVENFGGSADQESILYGMYGPTEATIHCTLQTAFSREMPVGNIGVPLETVSAFVIKPASSNDSSEEPIEILPIGEEGELAVGGYQLADGYLNRDEQTKAAFVQHPKYGTLYRTGDRATMKSHGKLECSGRISSGQVKLRGQRVELGEIEYAASKTPGCQTVIADVISSSLVVFCVCHDLSMKENAVRETCRKWLPTFMIPAEIVLLESLPYLPSGKVDRKALQEIYATQKSQSEGTSAMVTPELQAICDIISEVLQVPVDSHTSMSAAGLDSLSSIRIASRLRQKGFPQLDATLLLESQSVRDIESELERVGQSAMPLVNGYDQAHSLREAVNGHSLISANEEEIDEVFPATFVQSAMLGETTRDTKAYCNWIELAAVNEQLDRVDASLRELAAHHDLLRAGFLALHEERVTHAVIVWKTLSQDQIRHQDSLDYDFQITSDADLLHPCSFQLLAGPSEIRILLQIHHALYDQWSVDLLRKDLADLLRHREVPPRPSFRLISEFQETSLRDPANPERAIEYWQNHLREFNPTLLPLMSCRKQTHSLKRTPWREFGLDISSLKAASRKLGCGTPTLFQAVLAYLIGCYTGSTDVTYGVVFSGRHFPIPDVDSIFGPCLATLPLRIDHSTTKTVSDLVRLVQERNRSMQSHSTISPAEIKRASECAAGTSLFDTLFVWQETTLDHGDVDQVVQEVDSADRHEFNLVLEFEPSVDSVRARATYQQALIPPQQIEVLFKQIEALVSRISTEPDLSIIDMAGCLPSQSLSISNPSPAPCATGCDMIQSIERHAAETPDSPALVFASSIENSKSHNATLSYSDLNTRVNRLAHLLISLHVLPDDLVCICMEKSLDLYIAILAVAKAGAGYLPLVPETPASRVKSALTQSSVKISLCDAYTSKMVEGLEICKVVDLSQLDVSHFDEGNPKVSNSGSHVAYTVYTSGSTGEPKGVAVTRNNLLGNLQALAELYDVEHGDRLLQACSQAFDVSVFEIFFTFYTGICLCSATKDVLFYDLEDSVRALEITHLSLTPTVAALIDPANVPKVRFLVTAGEGVTDLVHARWAGKGLHQGYGPSETTNICTVNMDMSPTDATGNIGPPFRNTSAFVISTGSEFEILPAGALGEFAFGGEQVFRGYVGMDALNTEKIINHPEHGRIYKSGDVGRILHDGTLLISGRVDDQVKIRGNRVELGEINAVLLSQQGVHDCSTILAGYESSEQTLVTFFVPSGNRQITTDAVKVAEIKQEHISTLFERLEDSLPSYMIPTMIIPVTKMPLTTQGKLDRRLLHQVLDQLDTETRSDVMRSSTESEDTGDWTTTELSIADALADALDIETVNITRGESFSAFGLNSLNAIKFARAVSARMDIRMNVSTVLRNSSVRQLARKFAIPSSSTTTEQQSGQSSLLSIDLEKHIRASHGSYEQEIESILPCTPLQEAMLSASSLSSGSAYHNILTLRINGSLGELKRCWNDMVSRHSILRTEFVSTDDSKYPYVQLVRKNTGLPWEEWDSDEKSRSSSQDISTPESRRAVSESVPFFINVSTTPDTVKLEIHMHHALYDGISMSNLLQEIETTYRGEALSPPSLLEPFLAEVQLHNNASSLEFWSKQLRGFVPKPFPIQSSKETTDERSNEDILPTSVGELQSFCKRYGVNQLSVFQTAFAKILICSQNEKDVCFGNVVSGRTLPVEGIEELVAPCFNTVPVRIDSNGMHSNLALCQRLNQTNIDAVDHQLTALRRIQALSSSPSDHLFDSLMLLQPSPHELDDQIWTIERESSGMAMPLVLEITPKSDHYALRLHHLKSRVSKDNAAGISRAFASALASIIKYPHGSSDDFDSTGIAASLAKEDMANGFGHDAERNENQEWYPEEEDVRNVFSHLTGVNNSQIQKDTNMYQVGLDSLNAAQVASRLRELGHQVDAVDVMETLTPAALAASMSAKASSTKPASEQVDLQKFDKKHRGPVCKSLNIGENDLETVRQCTSVQNGMLAQSLNSNGELYINHVAYKIPERTNLDDLQNAWQLLRVRHQVLRMGFHQVQDSQSPFAMAILKPETAPLPYLIVGRELSLSAIEQQAQESIVRSIHTQAWRISIQHRADGSIMVLSLHHAIYDADSLRVILADLSKALNSNTALPATDIDPILSSILAAEGNEQGSSAKFWTESLQGVEITKFPDLTPTKINGSSLRLNSRICNASLSSVEKFCKDNGATIQAVGQTLWALLLAAYVGDNNVTFGTIFSGNPTSEPREATFPCITTIPVACDAGHSTRDIVKKMVDYNGSAQRHRFTPLADIQRSAGYPGESLFDTVFVYQKQLGEANEFDWSIAKETAAVEYTVSLEFETTLSDEVRIKLTSDTSRVPQPQARLMLQQYDMLLSQLISDQDEYLMEQDSILSILPPKEPCLPSNCRLLHGLFEESASRYPNREALKFVYEIPENAGTSKTWTYKELNERANQVANLIKSCGVEPESVVAVCMAKCPEASFAFLGILKAGCSFLAIDPELPESRFKFVLEDSSAKILFVDDENLTDSAPESVKCIKLEEKGLDDLSSSPVDMSSLSANATCYCLYTSGTTGTPKGCEITHENSVQAMMAFQRLFAGHWTEKSRWLQFASYWFDVSVLEQFWSWSVGIAVVGAPRDVVLDDLAGCIQALEITHIDLTPSLARLLQADDVPSLWNGVFITGGEALKQEIIDTWGPKATVCNGYGPTEATIGVTMSPFIEADAKPSNIGRQFDNVGSYVLKPDSDMPVLRGTVGELCVYGKLVGKGYLNRPDQTAKSFPFLDRFGERIYRTGDLVRLLSDGSFAFIGRKDSQAKIRGQRLEIGEIDSVIQRCSDKINDVVTQVIKSNDGGKETLVSFFTLKGSENDRELSIDSSKQSTQISQLVKDSCTSQLPGYMVPTHTIPISSLPLTVNKKVDMKRLTAFYNSASTKSLQGLGEKDGGSRSLTATELEICNALSNMLPVDSSELNQYSNLFSLGLSSISAVSFSALLRKSGFSRANVGIIMQHPTLGQLGSALSSDDTHQAGNGEVEQAMLWMRAFAQRHLHAAAQNLAINPSDIEHFVPCTPLQQGLIIESLKGEGRPYFNDFRYIIEQTDIGKLKSALQQLVDEAQILRTRFVDTDEGLGQAILNSMRVSIFEHFDGSKNPSALFESLKKQWIEKNVQSLESAFEVHIAHSSSGTFLVIHIHHALYDGISYDLMIKRLSDIFNTTSTSEQTPSFSKALAYGPLRPLKDAKAFWTSQLNKFHYVPLQCFTNHNKGDVATASAVLENTGRIEETRKRVGVPHQALMQASFEIAIRKSTPSIKTYGIVVSGRSIDLDGADGVLGPMFNTLPQPLDIKLQSSLSELAKSCHEMNMKVMPFQHTALRDIRKWCGSGASDGMFDCLFVFQHTPSTNGDGTNKLLTPIEDELKADYPLAFAVDMADDGSMTVTIVAKDNFFSQDGLQEILDCFTDALNHLLEGDEKSVRDIFGLVDNEQTATSTQPQPKEPYLNGVHDFDWTGQAKAMRKVIAELAGVQQDDVDEHSTIFAVGLDSIDAVKLASRLRNAGLPIPVSKILQSQTIPSMLRAVQTQEYNTHSIKHNGALETMIKQMEDIGLAAADTIERVLPATPNQEALMADMIRSELREYFNHDVLHLDPDTDLDRLKAAWQLVIDKNPILRTAFVEIADPGVEAVFAQVVHSPSSIKFRHHEVTQSDDLSTVMESVREEVLAEIQSVPPLRLTITSVNDERYLILSIAHSLYDGHSLGLLHEDVKRAYHDRLEPRPSYDEAIESALAATGADAHSFWKDTLSGAKAPAFPVKSSHQMDKQITHRNEKPSDISSTTARSYCQKLGVSMQALAQTCWAVTLSQYTQSLEVLFGVVLACRDSEQAEQVMFPTMNTVAARSSLHGSRAQMLKYVQGMINSMLPYQRTPLRAIQAACGGTVDRQGLKNGIIDTIFLYQHRPAEESEMGGQLYESIDGSSSVDYPVAVEFEEVDDAVVIRAACKSNVLDDNGTQKLLESIEKVLQNILNDPDEPTVDFRGQSVSLCGLERFTLDDSDRLVDVKGEEATESSSSVGTSSPLADIIIEALSQVSKVPTSDITPSSTVESIGIDSISAIKVASLLRKQSINLSVSELIKAKSPAKMAEVADSQKHQTTGTSEKASIDIINEFTQTHGLRDVAVKLGIDAENIEAVMPATAGQVYMLNMWQKTSGQLFYPTFKYEVETSLTLEQIGQAWAVLVDRHPILRTVFCSNDCETETQVFQVVLQDGPDSFATPDTNGKQPMVFLDPQQTAGSRYRLELRIHHALYDAVSLPAMMRDFRNLLARNEASHPKDKQGFEDFVAVTHRLKEAQKDFWTTYLRDVSTLMHLNQPQTSGAQQKVDIFRPAVVTKDIENLARNENLSTQSILFATCAKSYASVAQSSSSGDGDVVLGVYLSNRAVLQDIDDLAAPTLNLIPLMIRKPQEKTTLELAREVQKDLQEIGMPEHSSVALWEIYKWTGVRVDCFVNFIKLPETDEQDEGSVVIRETNDQRLEAREGVVEVTDKEFDPPKELAGLHSNAYLHSVDIEMTLADGKLDVGFFCLTEMVSLGRAGEAVEELKGLLENV